MARVMTVTLYKAGNSVTVNASEAHTWIEQGWSDKEPSKAPKAKAAKKSTKKVVPETAEEVTGKDE